MVSFEETNGSCDHILRVLCSKYHRMCVNELSGLQPKAGVKRFRNRGARWSALTGSVGAGFGCMRGGPRKPFCGGFPGKIIA